MRHHRKVSPFQELEDQTLDYFFIWTYLSPKQRQQVEKKNVNYIIPSPASANSLFYCLGRQVDIFFFSRKILIISLTIWKKTPFISLSKENTSRHLIMCLIAEFAWKTRMILQSKISPGPWGLCFPLLGFAHKYKHSSISWQKKKETIVSPINSTTHC